MIQVQDRFFLSIAFHGVEYPIESTGFGFFQLTTNINYFVPIARIQLNDPFLIFKDQITLADQTPVTITFGSNQGSEDTLTVNFRVFEFRVTSSTANMIYTIDLILDNVTYISNSRTIPLSDGDNPIHSYEAIGKMATECGFKTSVQSVTTDRQVWIPGGAKNCYFARTIAESGYADEFSCMVLCVTAANTLKYQNITNIEKTTGSLLTHRFVDMSIETNTFQVMSVKEITKSGLANNLFGHSQQTIEQTSKIVHGPVSAKVATKNLLVNSEINKSIKPRTVFTPVDCGNFHENHYKAIHQNTRLKSFYSMSLYIAIQHLTRLDLLDVIQYSGHDGYNAAGTVVKPILAGAYIIVGKTTYITGNGFAYEKFEVSRTGLNDDAGKTKSQLGEKGA